MITRYCICIVCKRATHFKSRVIKVSLHDEKDAVVVRDNRCVAFAVAIDERNLTKTTAHICKTTTTA